jgi:hypothetical protein
MERQSARTTKGDGKRGAPASRGNKPNWEEIERHLRDDVIVKTESILAGTGYWGRAEAEFANAISDETDLKRKKKMLRRRKELAVELKSLSLKERERILLEKIKKWKKKRRKGACPFSR